jgi:hypothetical protein
LATDTMRPHLYGRGLIDETLDLVILYREPKVTRLPSCLDPPQT